MKQAIEYRPVDAYATERVMDDVAAQIPNPRLSEDFLNHDQQVPDFSDKELAGLQDQPFYYVHGEVSVPGARDTVKWSAAIASDLLYAKPHMIVPGFGGFKRSSRLLRNGLASDHNSVAVSYEPVRRSGFYKSLFDSQEVHADTIEAVLEDFAAQPQLQDLPTVDFEQAILDPHSMGGLAAPRFAEKHPDRVALINFMECVGLEAADWSRFIKRLIPTMTKDIGPAIKNKELDTRGAELSMAYRAIRYYVANPARTIGEMASCMRGSEHERIARLGAQGVKFSAIYGEYDELIPAAQALAGARDLIDTWRILPIGHVGPQSLAHAPLIAETLADVTGNLVYDQPHLKSVL